MNVERGEKPVVTERALFVSQRLSAMLLAPLVIIHLLLILVAVRNGLSAAEILDRTRGSVGWAAFYGLFVVACAIHAPIGLRNILREWTPLGQGACDTVTVAFAVMLLLLGLRAVFAVIMGAG